MKKRNLTISAVLAMCFTNAAFAVDYIDLNTDGFDEFELARVDAYANNSADVNASVDSVVNIGGNVLTITASGDVNPEAGAGATATANADSADLRSSINTVAYGALAADTVYTAPDSQVAIDSGSVIAINKGMMVEAYVTLNSGGGYMLEERTETVLPETCVDGVGCASDVTTITENGYLSSYGFDVATYASGAAAISTTYIGYDISPPQ